MDLTLNLKRVHKTQHEITCVMCKIIPNLTQSMLIIAQLQKLLSYQFRSRSLTISTQKTYVGICILCLNITLEVAVGVVWCKQTTRV